MQWCIQGVVSCQSSPNRWVWSLPVTWQRWRSHHSVRHFWKPHAMCKLHDYLLWIQSYCRLKFYIAGIGNFAFFLRKIVEIIIFLFTLQKLRTCHRNTFFDPLPTVLAGMLPELHAFKVLYVLRRIGGRGHFRSRDKDGGHTPSSTATLVQYWTNIQPIWNIAHISAKM